MTTAAWTIWSVARECIAPAADATVPDDDATVASDDAVACGDDAATPEGVANSDDAARGDACDRRMCERADRPVITEATTHNRATTPHHMKSGAEGRR